MIPLGQFRDTFIIAVDDEGMAIIDQHVAHERVLFERVMERLTSGPARVAAAAAADGDGPDAVGAAGAGQPRGRARASRASRSSRSAAATIKVTAVPALLRIEDSSKALLALAEDLEGLDRGAQVQDALQRIAATDRVSRGGEGELSADLREDGAHPG